MDEQEQYLVDVDAAFAFAAELTEGVMPAPGRLRVLRGVEAELNTLALLAARERDLPYVVRFQARPRYEFAEPFTIPADAYETGWELPAEVLVGYALDVSVATREHVEDYVARLPEIEARRAERRRLRAQAASARAVRVERLRLRGPRARGAGRPGHRVRPRANAPPDDDGGGDGEEGESDPPRVARWWPRRASCCWGRV